MIQLTFTVDAPFGLKAAEVLLNGSTYQPELKDAQYVVTVPAEKITGTRLTFTIRCTDSKGVAFSKTVTVPVLDLPLINDPTPAPNSAVLEGKRPEISVTVSNAGEDFTAEMTVNGKAVTAAISGSKVSYTPDADLADGRVDVTVTVTRADGRQNTRTWKFNMGKATEQLYFGQLHAHTTYSDGAGSLETALEYVSRIPERDNIDFVSFTDHSNYFDKKGEANPEGAMYDMSKATQFSQETWKSYKKTVDDFNKSQSRQIALAGFEMTWSGGPGHINTFNTPGIVSRNNTTLNNKTGDQGMKDYYALLNQDSKAAQDGAKNWDGSAYDGRSLSQFNHPGKTFGNFSDFAYWDPVTDTRIHMVEVGNGEGKIHGGGYYPSYEQYTMALDKGWHVAPTNNQDNHKGRWGNANDARDVILTDDFSEEGIYQAIRDMRMYATEDKNLEIYYTVNGLPLGSIISEIPEKLDVRVEVADPDSRDAIAKVELIVNSGKVAHTWTQTEAASGALTCTLAPDYSYYYIRVTEADGDLAVTAPVWVGEVLKLGISSMECSTAMPVTGEELTLKTTLFNSEITDAQVTKVTYTTANGTTLFTDTKGCTVPQSGSLTLEYKHTFTKAMLYTVKVTVELLQNGKTYSYSKSLDLDVLNADQLVYIGFDAAHYNEYVAGNYKDSMGNFANLAGKYAVRTVYLNTCDELIKACSNPKFKTLILTAPSRRLADAQKDPRSYTAEELAALNAFNQAGGTIVLAGWSDHYEDFPDKLPKDFKHMAAAQNEVLTALGSSLRINDDATYDDKYSAIDRCDPWRLYFNTYNMDHPLNKGVIYDTEHPYDRLYTEVFSHYGGASIYAVDADGRQTSVLPETVSPIVFAHESTYSKDTDRDGLGGENYKYASPMKDDRMLIMASEQLTGRGQIIVSGAAFMSNFEVQAKIQDNGQEKNYANYRICENLVRPLNQAEISTIAAVQAEKDEGVKFTIEGIVTSNASGYDKDTAFFDCIYLQDDTAGINAFPVDGTFKLGDRVRITGHTSSYQGERQIAVKSIEKLGTAAVPAPRAITAAQLNDGSVLGSLVTLSGTVSGFSKDNGLIQTIMVSDGSGQEARVFIDGYITKAQDVQNLSNGCSITVTGLASYDESFAGPAPRIRIRDRADIVCTRPDDDSTGNSSSETVRNPDGSTTTTITKPNGTVVTINTQPDGVTAQITVRRDGQTTGLIRIPDRVAENANQNHTVIAPKMPPIQLNDRHAPSIRIELGKDQSALVRLPVAKPTPGMVAVMVKDDGTREVIRKTAIIEDSIVIPLHGPAVIEIVDNSKPFADLAGHWGRDGVDFASARLLFNGISGTQFAPDAPMTRAMLTTVIWRLEDEPAAATRAPFLDVADNTWYTAAVDWAVSSKIVKGLDETSFAPDRSVTRQELVTMMYRYAALLGMDTGAAGDLTAFRDRDAVADWASEAFGWAVKNGLVLGRPDGSLDPAGPATRAEMAAIFQRMINLMAR